jgi:hypothetical protein
VSVYDPNPATTVDFVEIVLEPRKWASTWARANGAFSHIEERRMDDLVRDRALHQLIARVYEDPARTVKMQHEIEVVDHASWRHALVASLPVGSFRRRFLCAWWVRHAIPLDYKGRRRVWSADFSRLMAYPKLPVPSEHLGPVVFPILSRVGWGE